MNSLIMRGLLKSMILIIYPDSAATFRNDNIVIIILESFAREYIGSLNKDLDNGNL